MNHFEFLDEPYIAKIRVVWLSVSEDFLILACLVLTVPSCDRRIDRRKDGQTCQRRLVQGPA